MFKWVFGIVRWLIILDWMVESTIKKILFKPKYQLEGSCKKCGKCCHHIGIVAPFDISNTKWIAAIIITFYEQVNDFTFLEYDIDKQILIFSCKHYNAHTRLCPVYFSRPALCRNYPYPRLFHKPEVIKGCGYSLKAPLVD